MCPLLSVSTCSITSSHFPLAISPAFPELPVLRFGTTALTSAREPIGRGVAVATPGVALFFEGQPPWEHGALRNVGKYSFIQTHSLPAFV